MQMFLNCYNYTCCTCMFVCLRVGYLRVHVPFLSFCFQVHVMCYARVLSCLGSSVGRALCLEYRVSWVPVPPEAAHFF